MATRKPIDSWYFELVKEACDRRCCACGTHESKLKQPLERGHMKSCFNDGNEQVENIIPVCMSCNRTYAKSDTPFDYLPSDWRERLGGLILLRLNPKYHVSVISNTNYMILTTERSEDTRVINFEKSNFGLKTKYIRDAVLPDPTLCRQVVDALIQESQTHNDSPNYPNPDRIKRMRKLVEDYGEEAFLAVGRRFLENRDWITPDNRFMQDSWAQFVDGFSYRYQQWKVAVRKAAELRKKQIEEAATKQDIDKAFVLVGAQTGLVDKLREIVQILEGYDSTSKQEIEKTVASYRESIDRARSIEELQEVSAKVNELFERLNDTSA